MTPVIIGDCTLYNADCREVLPLLDKVDVVITDPPYGIGFSSQPTRYQRANGMLAQDWDDETPSIELINQIVGAGDTAIVWGGNYFHLPPSRGWLVWMKQGNAPSMADLEMAWTSRDMNSRCFEKSVKSASLEKCLQTAAHPTQKPIDLMKWCIEQAGNPQTILDPFMGSGTTGVAAVQMGRKFIGIERESKYFEIACRRIEQAYAQPDFFVEKAKPKQEQGALL